MGLTLYQFGAQAKMRLSKRPTLGLKWVQMDAELRKESGFATLTS